MCPELLKIPPVSVLPLPVSASPVRSLLFIPWKNSKFPSSLLSFTAGLIFPSRSSLYVILWLKILSWIPCFFIKAQLLNLAFKGLTHFSSLPHCLREAEACNVGSGDRQTQSSLGSDADRVDYLPFLSHRFLIYNFGLLKVPTS